MELPAAAETPEYVCVTLTLVPLHVLLNGMWDYSSRVVPLLRPKDFNNGEWPVAWRGL